MTEELTAERRAERRLETTGPVKVRILANSQVAEGCLEDINNAGAFVTTTLDLKKGTAVHIEIEIPGEETTKALPAVVARRRAEVCRPNSVLPPGLGLKFVARTGEDLEIIRQTVMKTLAIDLLGHGNRKYDEPEPADTLAFGHPFYRPDSEPKP